MASIDGETAGDAVVFDVAASSRRPWIFLLIGPVLVMVGVAVYLFWSRWPTKEL